METRKKASLFKHLLVTIENFDKEHHLRLTTKDVESIGVDFQVFLKRFFRRLRKQE